MKKLENKQQYKVKIILLDVYGTNADGTQNMFILTILGKFKGAVR